jgi:hypothetical protein
MGDEAGIAHVTLYGIEYVGIELPFSSPLSGGPGPKARAQRAAGHPPRAPEPGV